MLLLRDQSPALLMNAWPEKRLPPPFGTRFIVGPPVSLSPKPPETTTDTSSTLAVSRMYDDTPPPLNVAATVMPLTAMRPSLTWPPRALKNVIVGVTATPLPSTVRPGVALSSEPTVRVAGIAAIVSEESTVSRRTLCTSTTGVSPVTVMVSSRPPTRSSTGIVSVAEPPSTMPFALHGAETRQRERQGVGTGGEVDQPVLARAVGHDGSDFFSESGTRRFNGDAGQNAARRVSDHAGQRALRERQRWHQGQARRSRAPSEQMNASTCLLKHDNDSVSHPAL